MPFPRFGRKERLEQVCPDVFGHTATVVGYGEQNVFGGPGEVAPKRALLVEVYVRVAM